MARVVFSSVIPGERSQVFSKLFRADDWDKGLPIGLDAKVVKKAPVREGSEIEFRVNRYGVAFNWGFRVEEIHQDQDLTLVQTVGFFDSWVHHTVLEDHGAGQTLLKDYIEYEMPLGLVGKLADDLIFRRDLKKLLEDRHERIRGEF